MKYAEGKGERVKRMYMCISVAGHLGDRTEYV
jgi:hypothetical protein